jgi:ABC-type glycerol-3-phosphate transport system permease component
MKNPKKLVRLFILYILAILGAVVMVLPFLFMISNSLKANVFVIEYPPQLIPSNPSFENFLRAWDSSNFKLYFANSAFVAIISTFFTVLVSATTAYAFARFKFPAKEFLFFFILLVLMVPDMATVTIFSFMGHWDEFTWALTAIDEPLKRTLPVAIYSFQGQHGTEWGLVFAAMIIAIIPTLMVFLSLQKYFIKGLTSGSIKG